MKYAYFPGCSASSTGISYTLSYNYVARCCGIELAEIPDWNCCGASAAHAESHLLSESLAARSLALSEATYGNTDILAPCAGCYLHLKTAQQHGQEDEALRHQIEDIIQKPWSAEAQVINGIEPFLDSTVQEKIKDHVCHALDGLKVACYYGCALLRPGSITHFDDDEQPHVMEDVIALTGATPIEWSFKNECCGASHHVTVPQAGRTMVRKILENAALQGADAIVCACPLCMLNLDMREEKVNALRAKEGKEPLDIPIYYFTELIAASFGANESKIGLNRHFHPAANLHERAFASWHQDQLETEQKRQAEEAKKQAKRAQRKAQAKPKAPAKATEAKAKPEAKPADAKAPADAKPADSNPTEAKAPAKPTTKDQSEKPEQGTEKEVLS